jgi:hypothetical protein
MPVIVPSISTGYERSKRPKPWCACAAVDAPSEAHMNAAVSAARPRIPPSRFGALATV